MRAWGRQHDESHHREFPHGETPQHIAETTCLDFKAEMSAFSPAPRGPWGKEKKAPVWAAASCSAPRAGLGPTSFPQWPWGHPGLERVHTWCHLVASGHRKGRGSFIFIICIIITVRYSGGTCLRGVSVVWAVSGPLPGCETCGKTRSWGSWCKLGCTERVDIFASQITGSWGGRL